MLSRLMIGDAMYQGIWRLYRSREIPVHPVLYVAQLRSPLTEINSTGDNSDLLPGSYSYVLLALDLGA